jgi:hypothetical protein
MTNRESKEGWLALVPKGSVRFKRTQGPDHKFDQDDTLSYLGDHCQLTEPGERLLFSCYQRSF